MTREPKITEADVRRYVGGILKAGGQIRECIVTPHAARFILGGQDDAQEAPATPGVKDWSEKEWVQ